MSEKEKITVGTEGTLRKITCPFCGVSEFADENGQFENFEFEGVAQGYEPLQVWKCNCGERFLIDPDNI